MRYKKVGGSGLKVSEIALGTMTYGNQVNEADAINIINMAFEKGVNYFDTANGYAGGRSEEIVGKTLKDKRQKVIIATKVFSPQGTGPNDSGLSRGHIIRAIDGSLRRLNTDYIDIYYAHAPDYSTPIEETLRTFDDLVRLGKVRYAACSNFRAWQLEKALWTSNQHNSIRFECIQSPYNLITRDIEYELLPCCVSEGIGVMVYNPLAGGLLTGKHNPDKEPAPDTRFGREKGYYQRYWSPVNFTAVDHLKKIADAHDRSMTQFSLAWIMNNPIITSVIVGASSTKHLEENMGATELKLTEEELKACDDVWRELRPPRFFYGR